MKIKFLHIPKTAGTTLIERLWHNPNFGAVDREPQLAEQQVQFGHSVKFDEPDPDTIYVTALRDPVERIMSQYNFVRSQLHYMNPDNPTELDFYTWFINKDHFRPMRYTSMIDWLNQCQDYWTRDIMEYDRLYSNQILHWDGTTTGIDQQQADELTQRKQQVLERHYDWFMTNTHPRISHYISTGTDVIAEFEGICEQYNISFDSTRDITRTNVTSQTLKFQKSHSILYSDLPGEQQHMIQADTQYERKIYDELTK
ncbi:sulfotransferase family 2 domain-containing protein [bacterium]|nr:sulfotransferase family 2 domain-containing protein [bacterium]